jgi:predicted DsbA family dithiol-disulfide isomerase
MLKLLIIITLLSSTLVGFSGDEKKTQEYLKHFFNSVIDGKGAFDVVKVDVREYKDIKDIPQWRVYFVDVTIQMLKGKKEEITVHEKVFTNGRYISRDFLDIRTRASLQRKFSIDIKDNSFYNKKHLIYGDGSEKNKIVVFSDPLCPFCQEFMPEFLNDIKNNPKKVAIYYYHLPLTRLHPASPTIAKAMNVAISQGVKDVVLNTYKSKSFFEFKDRKPTKQDILKRFNKALGTNIEISAIENDKVLEELKEDKKYAQKLMIGSTPTIYINGKKDNTRYRYKKILGLN